MSDSSAGTVVLVHGGFADGSGSQGVYHELTNDQVPWGLDAATGTIDEPAWRSKTSCYLATTDDRMIPPALQREMSERAGATCRDPGSHSIYVSQPRVVADVIERAASGVGRLREELR